MFYLQGQLEPCTDQGASTYLAALQSPGRGAGRAVSGYCIDGGTVGMHYSLCTRLRYVFIGLEQTSDVYSLAAPQVPVHSPVQRQFQRPAVEGAV